MVLIFHKQGCECEECKENKRIKIETDDMKMRRIVEEKFKNQPSRRYTQD